MKVEQERRKELGVDSETVALALQDNIQLSKKGTNFTKSFLDNWCKASFPSLPDEGLESIAGHLISQTVVTCVARNLGVEDLTMSAEFPVPDDVLYSTFMAVIGALQESSGTEQTGFFLRVRDCTEKVQINMFILNHLSWFSCFYNRMTLFSISMFSALH